MARRCAGLQTIRDLKTRDDNPGSRPPSKEAWRRTLHSLGGPKVPSRWISESILPSAARKPYKKQVGIQEERTLKEMPDLG
jgi:hypothetical protein